MILFSALISPHVIVWIALLAYAVCVYGSIELSLPWKTGASSKEQASWIMPYLRTQLVVFMAAAVGRFIDDYNVDGFDNDLPTFQGLYEQWAVLHMSLADWIPYVAFYYCILRVATSWDKKNQERKNPPTESTLSNLCCSIGAKALVFVLFTFVESALDARQYEKCDTGFWSKMSIADQISELVVKWHEFHPPDFYTLRISHVFIYLDIFVALLGTNHSSWQDFVWRLILRSVLLPTLADSAHYVDSPKTAYARGTYEETVLCSMDRIFIRDIVSLPMNWLFLVTRCPGIY